MRRGTPMTDPARLDRFFRPASVAVVGATPQRGSARNTLLRVLLKHGFAGRVYPVTRSHAEVEGLRAYASLAELPEAPDVALVITPAATVPGLMEECAARGVKNAIVYSAGFEEIESGREHARRLAAAARAHDVTVLGANCQGVWSVRAGSMLTFASALLAREHLRHAPIAVISQSGALAGAIGYALQDQGMGCAYVVSVGNETCLDAIDALDWVIGQDDVRVVALYVEGLRQAQRILPVAARARARGVHVVMLKTGRSAMGRQATASHTGKIASAHNVYRDLLEQAGVITVESLADALAAMESLAFLAPPRASADRQGGIAIISSSGGASALLADHAAELGLPLATFSDDTAAKLDRLLPDLARKANPIDLTGQIYSQPNLFHDSCVALRADPRSEALLVQFASSARRGLDDNAEVFTETARTLPVVVGLIGQTMDPETRRGLLERGIVLATDPLQAMKALSFQYRAARAFALPPAPVRASLTRRAAPRDFDAVMALCREAGLEPAGFVLLAPGEAARDACGALRFPVAVKVLPEHAAHKTELGLVVLDLRTPDEVDARAARLRERLGRPDAPIIVQEMVAGGVEVVLAGLRATDFGPVLAIGSGGVGVELDRDVVHVALPASPGQIERALQGLRLASRLAGWRGRPPADVPALVEAAARFGDLFLACPELAELEINPLMVLPSGQGLRVVDALATPAGPGTASD